MVRGRNNRIRHDEDAAELAALREVSRFHFVDGVREVGHLGVELRKQILQPVDAVEDLDALRVRVESHLERPAHSCHLRREKFEIHLARTRERERGRRMKPVRFPDSRTSER